MVKIEIDGNALEAPKGAMIIEVADQAGIVIPRFCYHHKLSVAANCRMCLVEVEKAPKTLPACATPVMDGMKVFTHSPKALASQKSVMEFLLINHPLDCPICDQGGECPLQETAMGFGKDVSRFSEGKRVVVNKDLGPLVATDMTRCIHCTRCVRFGVEIGGVPELGATGRGEHTEIGTYVKHALVSEVAGNIIDLCPVGALTSKPFRFSARSWELQRGESISPHDAVGANLEVHTKQGKVMRVIARENEAVNECWIADRDRFSYLGVNSEERLRVPMVKRGGAWVETDWSEALEVAAKGLKRAEAQAADRIGALVSASATSEEAYLAQKLIRGLGSNNIDHRLRQSDFSDDAKAPVFPWLGMPLQDLEELDAALLVGSHVRREQPLVGVRLRKAAVRREDPARLMFVNPVAYEFNFPVHEQLVSSPADLIRDLAAVAKVLKGLSGKRAPAGMAPLWGDLEPEPKHEAIAQTLFEGKRSAVLMGALAAGHPAAAGIRALCGQIAKMSLAHLGYLGEGGNAAGAWLAGAVPHRLPGGKPAEDVGKDWRAMLRGGLDACLLLGVEPDQDTADPALTAAALGPAFVVSLTAFDSPSLRACADVMLPVGVFTETSGTLVNAEGRWQGFRGVSTPPGEARPAWKVLRVLANLAGVEGCEYFSSDQVLEEFRAAAAEVKPDNGASWQCPEALELADGIYRVGEVPIYAVDPLVRRSSALQGTPEGRESAVVRIHPETGAALGLEDGGTARAGQGGAEALLPVRFDSRVAPGAAHIAAGVPETAELGAAFGPVTLTPAAAEEAVEAPARVRA